MDIKVGYRYYKEVFLQKGRYYKSCFTITKIKKDNLKIEFDNKKDKEFIFVPVFKYNFIEAMKSGDITEDKDYNKVLKRKDIIDDLL